MEIQGGTFNPPVFIPTAAYDDNSLRKQEILWHRAKITLTYLYIDLLLL